MLLNFEGIYWSVDPKQIIKGMFNLINNPYRIETENLRYSTSSLSFFSKTFLIVEKHYKTCILC